MDQIVKPYMAVVKREFRRGKLRYILQIWMSDPGDGRASSEWYRDNIVEVPVTKKTAFKISEAGTGKKTKKEEVKNVAP